MAVSVTVEWQDGVAIASTSDGLASGFGETEAEALKNLSEMLADYIHSRWNIDSDAGK